MLQLHERPPQTPFVACNTRAAASEVGLLELWSACRGLVLDPHGWLLPAEAWYQILIDGYCKGF